MYKTASGIIDRATVRRWMPMLVICGVVMGTLLVLAAPTLTQAALDTKQLEATNLGATFGGTNVTPMQIIGNIVKFFLGFLAIVAVLLIMYGGWKWMTSRGDSKQVDEAKQILRNAVIGLALVLVSYGIATAVINIINQRVLQNAGGNVTTGSGAKTN